MKRLLAAMPILLMPVQAFAYGCNCGTINTMLNMSRTQIIQQINANTSAEAQAIRSEIITAAQNIIGTLKSESATIVQAIAALKESNVSAIKGQSVARETLRTEDMYGQAAQPKGLCGSSSVGAGVQLAARAGTEIQRTMRKRQHEYANTPKRKPVEFISRVLGDEHPTEQQMLEAMEPLEETLTDDQVAHANEAIKTLAKPQPLPVATDAQKDTPAGQIYAAARKIHESRQTVAMESLNSHVRFHASTLPGAVTDWAQNQWSEAGGEGTPPGIVNSKLSEAGLYKLLAQMRIGNPNWFAQIATESDSGLLRELVVMQAFLFEIMRKNTELLDRQSIVASLDYLTRLEHTTGKELDDLYSRMVGAQH